jgi:ketopantoate hydroxymethyltransferase
MSVKAQNRILKRVQNDILVMPNLFRHLILKAFGAYREEMLKGSFPTDQHSFHIDEKELSKIKG